MMHLVTGGSGFIGAALVDSLVQSGQQVRVLDDHSRGAPRRLNHIADQVEIVQGDVRNAQALATAAEGCQVMWHLAYINGTRFFYEKPDEILDVGIRGTLNAIDAALSSGCERFVFASTSETYNNPTHVPTTEDERLMIPDITNPRFSYGGGKIAGELLTLHFAQRRGLETVIVRPHNIYGPDMGFEHVVPEIVQKIVVLSDGLKKSSISLPIQGDGSETRAFCYVTDGAEGFQMAGLSGNSGSVYHLGVNEEISIRELIKKIGDVLGVSLDLVAGELRKGGTPRRCPDITRLQHLGYSPKVSLQDGLTKTVEWYAKHFLNERIGD